MSERCKDCAFTPGTVPNLYWPSKMRADLCLISGEPFYCHHGEKPVCKGWIEERRQQGPVPAWKAEVAKEASAVFESMTEGMWTDVAAD